MTATLPAPVAIADYEVLAALGPQPHGQGLHGGAYLARRPPRLVLEFDFAEVVVKALPGQLTNHVFQAVGAELRRFAALRSPYLVTLFEFGRQGAMAYCSMQHVTGGSLAAPADPTRVLKAVADAARGAADLHVAGLVHGRITPSNILAAPYGAKLAEPDLDHLLAPGRLVRAGAAAALEYADPDRLHGAPPLPHHDVWSLGAVLHRVTAGTGIYGDLPPDPVAALRRVVGGPSVVSPALPPDIAELVRHCLSEPAERPAAAAVAERLSRR